MEGGLVLLKNVLVINCIILEFMYHLTTENVLSVLFFHTSSINLHKPTGSILWGGGVCEEILWS